MILAANLLLKHEEETLEKKPLLVSLSFLLFFLLLRSHSLSISAQFGSLLIPRVVAV